MSDKTEFERPAKDHLSPSSSSDDFENNGHAGVVPKSAGVARMGAIREHLTLAERISLFFGVFLIAYAYGLDGTIRYTYQPIALASYAGHSLITTVGVVRTVIAAAAQPTAAKVADVFGRLEILYISIFFYVLGTIVEAASNGVVGFCVGAILYQIGYTIVVLLVEVIIADITSLRSRLLWSYIPATPFLINTWVSGDVTAAVLGVTSWRWGIGMWAIIYPVCAIPLIAALVMADRRAKKANIASARPYARSSFAQTSLGLFWQLDVIGIVLMIAMFALILVPFTLAGGVSTTWRSAHIIAPLVIGILLIPCFVLWQKRAPHPLVPFHLLSDRAIWAGLGIAWMLNFIWYLQGSYLYTSLYVAYGESIKSATRISSLYSFVSVLTGCGLSLIVRFGVPYLKPFIVFGTLLFLVAFGVLYEFRGGPGAGQHAGIIGAECLLGFAGGLFPYPAQTSVQSATKHEHVALVTGLYLATYNIGSAFGSTISGAIWTQTLPGKLAENLALVSTNTTLAATVYGDPFTFSLSYPMGTPERTAVVEAYRSTQRLLVITGMCLCILLITFSLFLRNPRLTKDQSLPDAERGSRASRAASGAPEVVEEDGTTKKSGFLSKIF